MILRGGMMQEARSEADRLRELPLGEAQALCRDRARNGGADLAALDKALAESADASDRAWHLLIRCYQDPEAGFEEVALRLRDAGAVGLTGWDRGWTSGWLPAIVARRILTAPDLVPPYRKDPDSLDARTTVLWLRVLAECPSLVAEDRAFLRWALEDPDLEVWPHAARAFGRNALHDADLRGELLDEIIAQLRQGRIEFPHAARRRRARAFFVAFCAFLSASPLPAEVGLGTLPEPPFEQLPTWVRGVIRGHSLDFLPARLSDDIDLATVLLGCDCLLEVEAYRPRMRERLAALLAFLQKRPYPISTEMVGSLLARAVRAGHLDAQGREMLKGLAEAWGRLDREGAPDRVTSFLVFEHLARCLAEMAHGDVRDAAIEALLDLADDLPAAPEVARTAIWEALWSAAEAADLPPRAKTWLHGQATRGLDLAPVGAALASSEAFEFVHSQRWLASRVGVQALARLGLAPSPEEGPWVGPLWRETVATLLGGLQHAAAWNLLSPSERALYVWRLCHLFEEGILAQGVRLADVLHLIAQAPSPGTEEYGALDARVELLLELFVRASELDGRPFSTLPRLARGMRGASFEGTLGVIQSGPSPVLEPWIALDLRRHFRRVAADPDASLRDLYRLALHGARPDLFSLLGAALRESVPDAADLAEAVGRTVGLASDPVELEARLAGMVGERRGEFLDAWRGVRSAWPALETLTWVDPQADLEVVERGLAAAAAIVSALRDPGGPAWDPTATVRAARERLATLIPASLADLEGLESRWRTVSDAILDLRRGVGEALPPLERARWEVSTAKWAEPLSARRERAGALEMAWRACRTEATREPEAVERLARSARELLKPERAQKLLAAISEQWAQDALSGSAPGDRAERLLRIADPVLTAPHRHGLVWAVLTAAMDRGGEADVRAWFSRLDAPTHAERKRVAQWWLDRYAIVEARRAAPDLAALWPLHHAPALLGILVGHLGMIACGAVWVQLAEKGRYLEMAVILIGSVVAAGVCVIWDLQERGIVPRGLPSSTALLDGLSRAAPLLGLVVCEALVLNLAGQLLLARTPLGWGNTTWWGASELVLMTSGVTLFLGLFVGAVAFRRHTGRRA